jgi:predicted KAP-like P-loop ATPase
VVNTSIDELKNLHNAWIAQLRDEDKQPIKNLLMHLFPKLKLVWGNSYLDEELKLREQLRVCSLEIFPIYFRLTLSTSELSNTEIKAILALAEDADKFGEHLIKLANQKRLDGTTQVRAFLEQLENYPEQEIPVNYIPSIVQALFDVSEQLLCAEEKYQSIFNFGNEVIISRFISRSLRRLDEPSRFEVLKKAISQGKALTIISHEIATLKEQQSKYSSDKFNLENEWLVNAQHFKELSEIATKTQQSTDTNDKSIQFS